MTLRKNVLSLSPPEKLSFVEALLELKKRGRYNEYVHWHHHIMIPTVLADEPRISPCASETSSHARER